MPPLHRLYLIDTDHLSLWERGGVEGENLRFRLRALAPDDYGTTIVNYEEQTRGRLAQVAAAKTPETEVEAYSRLHLTLRFYSAIAVWQYSDDAAAQFRALKKAKIRIGTKDLLIASIALANNAIVLRTTPKTSAKSPASKLRIGQFETIWQGSRQWSLLRGVKPNFL